jgi:hypothetical protein
MGSNKFFKLYSRVAEPEPRILARAGISKFRLRLPAPGQLKYIEQDLTCELGRFSFIKNMKNVLFNIKSVKTGSSKAVAGARAGSGAGAGAGAEKNSFGPATLLYSVE